MNRPDNHTGQRTVRKAIIPAAGLGTRILPLSKSMPKEMIPIVDKPSIQYIVEEAVSSGIEDILIITNRGKEIIEDYFDHSIELEDKLLKSGKLELAEEMDRLAHLANIYFIRQKEVKGLGHAVLTARSFVGNEPFAVLYGDDVIISEKPVTQQLCEAYEKYGNCVVGVNKVLPEHIHRYSSLKVEKIEDRIYNCTDMIEKPAKGCELSLFSILGRCLLTPEIFDILEVTQPGVGGEIQLTDAMRIIAQREGMTAVDFEGTRYDIGNKLGILTATVDVALKHPEIGNSFREYLRSLKI